MGKKPKQIYYSNFIEKIKEKVALSSDSTSEPYIPDIMEFCNSKKYLNLPGQGIELFPMQKIILKSFYRGQRGNEHLSLNPDELKILFENKLQSILDKYHSENRFRELILVLGRRSGKDFMTSIIALYETMKLLECSGGSPFTYYGIAPGNPIYIMTVATSSDQAKILFLEIRDKMHKSEYFKPKISKVEVDKIWLKTPEDRKNTEEAEEEETVASKSPGSVVIMSGHSNSESLLGKRIFCLLLDEVASFKSTGGKTSGDRIYSALGPSTADFRNNQKKDEEDGYPSYDSKIISISSPRAEEGMLYKLYSTANDPENRHRLAFRLPTWKVNLLFTEGSLRKEFKFMSPTEFAMEFGAEFSGTSGERYIPEIYVEKAQQLGMELNLTQRVKGERNFLYYAHLDPATTSHNYSLAVIHTEDRIRIKHSDHESPKKERYKLFVVDHIKIWTPSPDRHISVHEVDEYIIDLARRFRFVQVTYDEWNSKSSIEKLRKKGIASKPTPYRKSYKMAIYTHLEHLLINNQIAIPFKERDAEYFAGELKYLKRIYRHQGFSIEPDPEAPIKTDDVCDAVAGACGQAIEASYNGFPRSTTVYMPQSSLGQNVWNMGRGSYNSSQWTFINSKFGKF